MSNIEDNIISNDTNGLESNEDNVSEVDSILDGALDNSDEALSHDGMATSISQNALNLDAESFIRRANAEVLLRTLAPQITKNEKKKREHKDKLIKYVSIFLGVQFIFVFVIIIVAMLSIICFHALDKPLDQNVINILFAFFGTYITSVIVELFCILKYIVLRVFDTSISALTKAFSGKDDKEQEN